MASTPEIKNINEDAKKLALIAEKNKADRDRRAAVRKSHVFEKSYCPIQSLETIDEEEERASDTSSHISIGKPNTSDAGLDTVKQRKVSNEERSKTVNPANTSAALPTYFSTASCIDMEATPKSVNDVRIDKERLRFTESPSFTSPDFSFAPTFRDRDNPKSTSFHIKQDDKSAVLASPTMTGLPKAQVPINNLESSASPSDKIRIKICTELPTSHQFNCKQIRPILKFVKKSCPIRKFFPYLRSKHMRI